MNVKTWKNIIYYKYKTITFKSRSSMTITEIMSSKYDYSYVNNTFDDSLYLKRLDTEHFGLFDKDNVMVEIFDKEKALINLPHGNWEFNSNDLYEIQKQIKIGNILQSYDLKNESIT